MPFLGPELIPLASTLLDAVQRLAGLLEARQRREQAATVAEDRIAQAESRAGQAELRAAQAEGRAAQAEMRAAKVDTLAAATYQATIQLSIHAEQIRWTLLSGYLVINTILLVVWATLFVAEGLSPTDKPLLTGGIALLGILLSLLWIGLGDRANQFIDAYAALGREVEREMPEQMPRPFHATQGLRKHLRFPGSIASTRLIILGVPVIFLPMYAVLAWLSFGRLS